LVPALRFDDGELLTECAAILQALAGIAGAGAFMPAAGTREHLRALEWLNFVATEVHKHCLYPLFSPAAPAPAKAWAKEQLQRKLAFVAGRLETQPYLAAGQYTVADAYMAWALFLCELGRIELPDSAAFRSYWQRLRERPAVVETLAHERELLKAAAA
jgi:glutathione S-transferase